MKSKNKQAFPVALVTGAAWRIGRSIACHLHKNNYRIAIHCRNSLAEANALAKSLNTKRKDSAKVFCGDLNDSNFIKNMINGAILWGQRLDVLVNNASIFAKNHTKTSLSIFDINVVSPYILSQEAYFHLKKTKGVIINITDIHAIKPLKDYSLYCQSKAALNMQTKSLALEFAPNVRVNAVAPGAIIWPEADNMVDDTIKEKIIRQTPLKCHGKPEDIAKAVFALIDAKFITGQILGVDGGRSLN